MFASDDIKTLFAESFPFKAPAVAVLIGDVKSKAVTGIQLVLEVGSREVIILELVLYQNVITFGVMLLPFLHCSPA
jgi:hypothetical protein